MAHTHPLSSPFASPDDVKLARRIRMPIFVLTPNMVRVVHADGRVETLVDCKQWIPPEVALTITRPSENHQSFQNTRCPFRPTL